MAGRKESVLNVDTEENTVTETEGADGQKDSAVRDKLGVKRQRSRAATKKKERTFDWPKKSLYAALYAESKEGAEEKSLIHRVFIISKIGDGTNNRTEVGNHFDGVLKNLKTELQTEPITGLMLIYMKHIVHVMECSADAILEISRELCDMEGKSTPLISKSKILVISHDIPQRQYQGWSFRTLDIVEPGLEAYEPGDTTENLVVDLLTQLLRLGNFLAKQPKLNLKNAMDSLHDKVPELLPQQAVVHYLLGDDDPCIMTPKEYVDIYEKPFDTILESDLVWPLPTKLFPYN